MIIGILSDTHDKLTTIGVAFDIFRTQGVQNVVHCGDWTTFETLNYISCQAADRDMTIYGVTGNRDTDLRMVQKNDALPSPIIFQRNPEYLELMLDGVRLHAYHGHNKAVLQQLIADDSFDVLLTGHTHKPLVERMGQKLILNPGSTAFSIPRRREPRTIAVIDTQDLRPKIIKFDAV